MNKRTLAAFVLSLAAAGAISAQSVTLRAKIPFSFTVNGRILPTGEYTAYQGSSPSTMIIRETDHGVGAVALVIHMTARSTRPDTARLVFNRYGDRFFLSQIWTDGVEGSQLPRTRPERELSSHRNNPKQTVVAALR